MGGAGNDTYVLQGAFGQDTIDDSRSVGDQVSDSDVVDFRHVDFSQLWFSQSDDDLVVEVMDSESTGNSTGSSTDNQSVTISDWYGSGSSVDAFNAGGSVLLEAQVNALVQAMASASESGAPSDLTTLSPEDQQEVQLAMAAAWS